MDRALEVIEQQTVAFYDDEVLAIRANDGTVYIPVRPICDLLGVSWSSQQNRINRDLVLSELTINISVFVTNTQGKDQHREMLCLPLDYISGFLFGINASRVKDSVRERLVRYQKECFKVLSEAFSQGRLSLDEDFDLLNKSSSPAAQAYRTAEALLKLARHQLILESRIDTHEERIELLESIVSQPKHHITSEQASQVSQAVKAIALELGKRSGRNEYGGVYGELYRRFEITSYKELPATKFAEAISFLSDWYSNVTGQANIPF